MITFVAFCTDVLGLTLSPAWRVLLSVAIDHIDPAALSGSELPLARQLFGDIGEIPDVARKTLVLRLGRGSGKTTVSSAYAVYAALTTGLSTTGPGMRIGSVIVGPSLRTARMRSASHASLCAARSTSRDSSRRTPTPPRSSISSVTTASE